MNEKNIIDMKEKARQYAYFSSKRKNLEAYKTILLYRIMKEISAKEKFTIADQKKAALETYEYKNLLLAIRNIHIKETETLWFLSRYIAESESYVTGSNFERKNNWNIHNI